MIFAKTGYKDFDKGLLAITFLIFLIGIVTIYSATQAKGLSFAEGYAMRQLSWMGIGLVFLAVCIIASYQRFVDLAYVIYGVNILLLLLVLIMGHVRLGAQRWFSIAGFAFQPSEFVKLSLILALSNYLGAKKGAMGSLKDILVPSILLAVPFSLVVLQPDLGSALLLLPIFFSMLLAAGASQKHIVGMMALGAASAPFFWHFLREHQRQRLLVFLNPNVDPLGAGYTIIQSKIAIGSGGLFGKGWTRGTQNQLNFLPERHTDFIFSVIGEEWGFLGAILIVFLFFLLIKKAFNTALLTSDIYGKAIAVGIAAMLGLQVIINIGMTIGLAPVVGIPLPLVSYGGSSLVSTLMAIGLLVNVGMRRSTF